MNNNIGDRSDHVEAFFPLRYGQHQLFNQNFLCFVVGQVQLVETCVCPRQSFFLELSMNVKLLNAVHASQVFEPLHWYF